MSALPAAKAAAVVQLVESVPDAALTRLAAAVSLMPGEQAVELGRMIARESRDRELRAIAFSPVAALFTPRTDGFPATAYPRPVMARLWKLASVPEPGLAQKLDAIGVEDAVVDRIGDQFLRAAARALRETPDKAWPAADPTQRDRLALLFELGQLMRKAAPRLRAWTARPDEDQVAELRVLFREAAAMAPDGAERFVELIFAHVADAPLILRIVTLSAEAASNSDVLSNSELAPFVDGLLEATEQRVARIEAFVTNPTRDRVLEVAAAVDWCGDVLREMGLTVKPQPDSRWGKAVQAMRARVERQALAALKAGGRAVEAGFPLARARGAHKSAPLEPDLGAPPDAPAIEQALSLLGMIERARMTLAEFGCESPRQATMKDATKHLADFAEKALTQVRGAGTDGERLIRRAAEVLSGVGEKELAKAIVRRLDARVADDGMAAVRAIA
ncbi:hypothetical protein [Brevundimonas balnearis]|uniref:Flagellar motor switch protein FliG n=1 Tax=Brevundimonas balnearis TaxID=1572858 RepID=A0ABV6R434_9CAUL